MQTAYITHLMCFTLSLAMFPIPVLGQCDSSIHVNLERKITGKPLGLNPKIFRKNNDLHYLLNNCIYKIDRISLDSKEAQIATKKNQVFLAVLPQDKLLSTFTEAGKRYFSVDCKTGITNYLVPIEISDNTLRSGNYAESNGKFIFCENRNFWIIDQRSTRKLLLKKINNWTSQHPTKILIYKNYAYLSYSGGEYGGALTRVDLDSNLEKIFFEDRMLSVTDMALTKTGSLWFTCSRAHLGPGSGTFNKLENEKIILVASTGAKGFERFKFFWAFPKNWSGENTSFSTVIMTPKEKLLIETDENELFCWNIKHFDKVVLNKKLDRKIYSIYFDSNESVFIVVGNDIYKATYVQ